MEDGFEIFWEGVRVRCALTDKLGTSGGPVIDEETGEADGWMYVTMDDGSIGEHDVVESHFFERVD